MCLKRINVVALTIEAFRAPIHCAEAGRELTFCLPRQVRSATGREVVHRLGVPETSSASGRRFMTISDKVVRCGTIGEVYVSNAVMFVLAVAAFAWGLSLASYRWVALRNGWPMGAWQADRPALPRLLGLGAVWIALVSAAALGGAALPLVLVLGLLGAFVWVLIFRIGAQSALLLAPLAAVLSLAGWVLAAT